MSEPTAPAEDSERLFFEPGPSWLWLLAGPAAALIMIWVQYRAGLGFKPLVPLFFLVVVSSVLAVQVKAGRLHTSVELTPDALREGTEVLLLREIVEVYPEATVKAAANRFSANPLSLWRPRIAVDVKDSDGPRPEKWQSARSLGELNGIPKGRTAIGLRLSNGRTAQAWARDADGLRAQLTRLVQAGS